MHFSEAINLITVEIKMFNIVTRCVYEIYTSEIARGANYKYRKEYTTNCDQFTLYFCSIGFIDNIDDPPERKRNGHRNGAGHQ